MWIDKTMNKIFGEAEHHFEGRANREQITEAFYVYWKWVSFFMKDVRFPRIYLPKFGYLVPKLTFIKKRITSFKENPEWGEDREYLLEQTQNAFKRIKFEKEKRKRK